MEYLLCVIVYIIIIIQCKYAKYRLSEEYAKLFFLFVSYNLDFE
jgi:hypothetical protein